MDRKPVEDSVSGEAPTAGVASAAAEPAPMTVICCLPPGVGPPAVPPFPAHWTRRNVATPAEIADAVAAGADAVLLAVHSPMERKTLERLRGIKLLQWVGVGLDTIDLEACRDLGIPVANVVASNSVAVAEYVILATMYIVRRMGDVLQAGREGLMPWPSAVAKGMYQVRGRTMGILSYGSIGREIAKGARGLGMKLQTASTPGREREASAEERELSIERVSFDRLVETCDVLALVIPLTPDTRNLFDRQRLLQMKKGSYLVNAARGGIVDEQALADLLHQGHLAGAAVDTFLVEPIEKDNPLWSAPNTLLTPHCGGNTMESTSYVGIEAFENINRVGRGEAPRYRVC
jgi:phosphoglycerate dehydrogenase-like enzyme